MRAGAKCTDLPKPLMLAIRVREEEKISEGGAQRNELTILCTQEFEAARKMGSWREYCMQWGAGIT